jgi:hypothetical protein
MALTITDRLIRGTGTWHTAELVRLEAGDAWRVSWLPRRLMDKDAAIAAMSIADLLGPHGPGITGPGDPAWADTDRWAAEYFGIAGPTAVAWASEPPRAAPPDGASFPPCPACGARDPHIGWAGDSDAGRSWRCTGCDCEWTAR